MKAFLETTYRPPCDSLLFDLDGTLWDASPASAAAWNKVALSLGINITVTDLEIKGVSGLPFDKCVESIFGNHSKADSQLQSLLDQAEKEEIRQFGGRFYEGMVEGIQNLSRHYKLFLISNCQTWYLESFFEHSGLRDYFQDSICFGDTHQPKKENIRTIIERHNLKAPIYVGDTHWDQEAAFYGGAKFIFARYGFGKIKVSSPTIDSISQLVQLMNAPMTAPKIEVRKLSPNEFELAANFYRGVGYLQTVQPDDKFYGAFHKGNMVGLVRLAFEHSHWILRGMQILPQFQFFGIGTKLIQLLETDLGDHECYCLPHGWLEKFYGQIGFQTPHSLVDVPAFLTERLQKYKQKHPQIILMKRAGGTNQKTQAK